MAIQFNPTFAHLNSNATTTLKSAPGNLATVTINTKGAGSNTLTLYDSLTAGTEPIAVIDTTAAVTFLDFGGLNFDTGLTAVMATGTAADVTVVFA